MDLGSVAELPEATTLGHPSRAGAPQHGARFGVLRCPRVLLGCLGHHPRRCWAPSSALRGHCRIVPPAVCFSSLHSVTALSACHVCICHALCHRCNALLRLCGDTRRHRCGGRTGRGGCWAPRSQPRTEQGCSATCWDILQPSPQNSHAGGPRDSGQERGTGGSTATSPRMDGMGEVDGMG